MALLPADMENCAPKSKCLTGINEGTAYDPAVPCANGNFNPVTCDCEVAECGATCNLNVKWKVSFASFTGAGCSPTVTNCSEFGGNTYSTTLTGMVKGTSWEFSTVEDANPVLGTCSGTLSNGPAITYIKCVNGVPTPTLVRIGAPGCSVNTSAGKSVISITDTQQTAQGTCKVAIEVFSELYQNTYDCIDCTGTQLSQTISSQFTSRVETTEADYETAYIDCSNLDDDCETSCIVRTAAGKAWHLAGWDGVTNCDAAGAPDSGQNFICPNNVSQPCNAYNRPDLRYYSNSGRLYDGPVLVE